MATNEQSNNKRMLSDHLNPQATPDYTDLEVSRTGYELWRAAGRPVGRYMEFLAQAEREHNESARRTRQSSRASDSA
jgi:hypothetical protein